MAKKYDYRRIYSYRSYKVRDICRIFKDKKLHEQTVRSWVNEDGLKAIWHGKTILIYGAVLKEYLMKKSSKKRTLEFSQFRCGKCKAIANPLNNIITKLTLGKFGSILALGKCECCGHDIQRLYKKGMEQEIIECFLVSHNELRGLSDSSCAPCKTNITSTPETNLNDCLTNPPSDKGKKSTRISRKTNIEPARTTVRQNGVYIVKEQLNLFKL